MDWEESGNTCWLSHDHFRSFCPSTAGRWKYLGGTTSSYLKPRTHWWWRIDLTYFFSSSVPSQFEAVISLSFNHSNLFTSWCNPQPALCAAVRRGRKARELKVLLGHEANSCLGGNRPASWQTPCLTVWRAVFFVIYSGHFLLATIWYY